MVGPKLAIYLGCLVGLGGRRKSTCRASNQGKHSYNCRVEPDATAPRLQSKPVTSAPTDLQATGSGVKAPSSNTSSHARKPRGRASLPNPAPRSGISQPIDNVTEPVNPKAPTFTKAGLQVNTRPGHPGVQSAQVLAALDDVAEFANSLSELLKKRDQMDFITRGMFSVVEAQIGVIREVSSCL